MAWFKNKITGLVFEAVNDKEKKTNWEDLAKKDAGLEEVPEPVPEVEPKGKGSKV